jgi:hypothetical protein
MDTKKTALEIWLQSQKANAGLLQASISNIVGARRYKAEQDFINKTGNGDATITVNGKTIKLG